MVERYRPSVRLDKAPRFSDVKDRAYRPSKRGSIKKSTLDRVAREGKVLRGKNTGDGFQNFTANLGLGTNNVLSNSQYGFMPITRVRTLLDWIHRGSWIGGIAVDLLAEDMTRGGIELLGIKSPKDTERLQQGMIRMQCWSELADNIKWAQLYGGSIAVLLIDGQDPSTPLVIDRVGRNKFKGLTVFDRWMVDPSLQELVTEYGPHLGLPKYYTVTADAPVMRGQRIHYSRCVRLIGVQLPFYQRTMENLWGLSVFERIYDRMIAFDSATLGASQLVYKSFIRTYKIDGLHEAATMAGGEALAGIAKRVELMRKYQGIEGITLLDSDDDFATHEASGFTGIADILVHFAEQMSGTLQIPLVRLMGQSPAGLNSTGESDLRTYYDNIINRQERDLREGVTLILRVLAMSLGIKLDPEEFNFNFVPLWQLNETEKSEVADKVTRMVLEAEAAGLISPKVALMELRALAKITGKWTNISDKDIAEASDVAEPPEPEMGEDGEGGGEGEGEEADPKDEPEEGDEKPPKGPKGKTPKGKNTNSEGPEAREKKELKGLETLHNISKIVGKDSRTVDEYGLPFTEVGGLQIVIETRAGTIRRGDGWAVRIPADYGYFRRIGSAEGEEEWLDVFVGPYHSSRDVWIVDAMRKDDPSIFDEHKCLIGFRSEREALDAFRKAYNDRGAEAIGAVTHMTFDELAFKNWIARGNKNEPLAPELREPA